MAVILRDADFIGWRLLSDSVPRRAVSLIVDVRRQTPPRRNLLAKSSHRSVINHNGEVRIERGRRKTTTKTLVLFKRPISLSLSKVGPDLQRSGGARRENLGISEAGYLTDEYLS